MPKKVASSSSSLSDQPPALLNGSTNNSNSDNNFNNNNSSSMSTTRTTTTTLASSSSSSASEMDDGSYNSNNNVVYYSEKSTMDKITGMIQKALPPFNTEPDMWEKDEVFEIFHWFKQLVAISLGILLGLLGVTGWMGYATLIACLYTGSMSYIGMLNVPDDILGGTEAFQEGLMPAVMTFTLFWTVVHTLFSV